MNKLQGFVAAAALAASMAAQGQGVVIGGQLSIAQPVVTQRAGPEDAFMRVQTAGGGVTLMAVEYDGSITLNYGATISFSREHATAFRRAGPVRYFIPVYVGDELVLLPLYGVVRPREGEEQ